MTDLTFLGAAGTVTGSQYLLETPRARILIDCGLFQGLPTESIRNRVTPPYDPKALDAVLLTHAHLDHCGALPLLVKEGYPGPVYATMATIELAGLVLLDSGRLHEEFAKREARWERRHPDRVASEDAREAKDYEAAIELAHEGDGLPHEITLVAPAPGTAGTREHVATTIEPPPAAAAARPDPEADLRGTPMPMTVDLDAPLYTEQDAGTALSHFRPIRYGQSFQVAPGITATFDDAGHILGSAIIRLEVQDADGGPTRRFVFSGDLGRRDAPILRDPTPETTADYVLCESTYGGREHDPQDEAVRILAETVHLVQQANGVLLVPSFAIGRTQEVVWQLDRLLDAGRIPQLPLYLDSPMATKATAIYERHTELYDTETKAVFDRGGTPLEYPGQHVTTNVQDSQAIEQAPRPYMIVASNGMLTGGRVVGHLRNLIDDPTATILFVGYQGKGTLGAHLRAGATTVMLDGQSRQVRCRVRSISGFSSHADEPQLLDWLRGFAAGRQPGADGFPRTVFLVHGDPDAQVALRPKVEALGFTVHVPQWHERVTLD